MFRHKRIKARPSRRRSAGQQALKKVNEILRMSELKHFTVVNNNLLGTNWNGQIVENLNNPAVGDNDNLRNGDNIACTFWELNMTILKPAATDATGNAFVRVIGFWDKQNTIAGTNDVLNTTGDLNMVNQVFNVDHRKEYIVLFDRVFNLTTALNQQIRFSHKGSLKKRLTQFQAASTDVNTGSLKFMIMSNIDDEAAVKPTYAYVSRIRYRDF